MNEGRKLQNGYKSNAEIEFNENDETPVKPDDELVLADDEVGELGKTKNQLVKEIIKYTKKVRYYNF